MKDDKTITASIRFAASHPASGGFFTVRFSDGLFGHLNIKSNGSARPLGDRYQTLEGHDFYNTVDEAVWVLHDILLKEKEETKGE